MTGTNFSDWYNASEGSFVVQANVPTLSANQCLLGINDGTTSNRIRVLMVSATALRFSSITSSVEDGSLTKTIANGANDFSIAYKLNNNAFSTNGTDAFFGDCEGNRFYILMSQLYIETVLELRILIK